MEGGSCCTPVGRARTTLIVSVAQLCIHAAVVGRTRAAEKFGAWPGSLVKARDGFDARLHEHLSFVWHVDRDVGGSYPIQRCAVGRVDAVRRAMRIATRGSGVGSLLLPSYRWAVSIERAMRIHYSR
jgi:hypothetical protein